MLGIMHTSTIVASVSDVSVSALDDGCSAHQFTVIAITTNGRIRHTNVKLGLSGRVQKSQ